MVCEALRQVARQLAKARVPCSVKAQDIYNLFSLTHPLLSVKAEEKLWCFPNTDKIPVHQWWFHKF